MTRATGETIGSQRHTAAVIAVVLGVAVAVFVTVTVMAARNWTDARDRGASTQAALDELAVTSESTAADLGAALQAQADAEGRAGRLRRLFTPEAVDAVVQFQDETAASGCDVARTSTRDGTELRTGVQVADYAAATNTDPALDGVPDRWSQMIDPTAVQAEIDRCAADEAARIEGERQAAAAEAESSRDPCQQMVDQLIAEGRGPGWVEDQFLFVECGIRWGG